jgi:shikimate kinase
MRYQLKKPIALIGMMGAGKTAIGKSLANMLSVPFLDSDSEIETASNMAIAEIFLRDGEAFFRCKETQILTRLLEQGPCVLSTGGGAFLTQKNQALIGVAATSIFLQVGAELLWSRLRQKPGRPLLQTNNPYRTLIDLLAQREPVYAQADIIVQAEPAVSIDQMADRVLQRLLEHSETLGKEQ